MAQGFITIDQILYYLLVSRNCFPGYSGLFQKHTRALNEAGPVCQGGDPGWIWGQVRGESPVNLE